MYGKSPKHGTLVSVFWSLLGINPPITTVSPSWPTTVVSTCWMLNAWLMTPCQLHRLADRRDFREDAHQHFAIRRDARRHPQQHADISADERPSSPRPVAVTFVLPTIGKSWPILTAAVWLSSVMSPAAG